MRWNGSVLGRKNPPNSTAGAGGTAPGVWNLRSQGIYRQALEWPRIVDLYTDLAVFYRFDDNGSGGLSLVDSSGNGRTLTAVNGPTLGSGLISGCASLTRASSQYLTRSLSFSPNSAYSLSAWINLTTIQDFFALVSGGSAGTLNVHGSANGSLFWNNAAAADVTVNNFFATNQWIHVVLVRNAANNMTVYKNGSVVYSSAALRTYSNVTTIDIGTYRPNLASFAWNGRIDAFGLWTRALSASEVALLNNSAQGLQL